MRCRCRDSHTLRLLPGRHYEAFMPLSNDQTIMPRAQRAQHPCNHRKHALVVTQAADDLNAYGQATGPAMGWQAKRRQMQEGPQFLESRVTG